jgi:predicted Rossmann fold nucleotide-binding protein DprA/Smf involved in DNA uptake
VPGSPGNRAALGVNRLLRDGAGIVLDVEDVLSVLSIHHERAPSQPLAAPAEGVHRRVFQACADEPRSVEGVALATGIGLVEAATALTQLESAGWLRQLDGWYEPTESAIR